MDADQADQGWREAKKVEKHCTRNWTLREKNGSESFRKGVYNSKCKGSQTQVHINCHIEMKKCSTGNKLKKIGPLGHMSTLTAKLLHTKKDFKAWVL